MVSALHSYHFWNVIPYSFWMSNSLGRDRGHDLIIVCEDEFDDVKVVIFFLLFFTGWTKYHYFSFHLKCMLVVTLYMQENIQPIESKCHRYGWKKCDYMFWTVINLEMFEKSYKCKSIVVLTFFCLLFSSQKSQFTYAEEIRNLLKFGSLKVFLQFYQCWLFIQMHLKWNEAFPNMNCF